MQSKAKSVGAYLKEVPRERQACLTALRALCLEVLTGYEEGMGYGMPCYRKGDQGEVGFASQKNYIALYILKTSVLDRSRARLKGLSVGKCCIRFRRPNQVDFSVVRQLLLDTVASPDAPC